MLLKAHFKVVKNPLPPTKKSPTESPLKMMKNYFYFTLKARFVLKIEFWFLFWLFGHVEKPVG